MLLRVKVFAVGLILTVNKKNVNEYRDMFQVLKVFQNIFGFCFGLFTRIEIEEFKSIRLSKKNLWMCVFFFLHVIRNT